MCVWRVSVSVWRVRSVRRVTCVRVTCRCRPRFWGLCAASLVHNRCVGYCSAVGALMVKCELSIFNLLGNTVNCKARKTYMLRGAYIYKVAMHWVQQTPRK